MSEFTTVYHCFMLIMVFVMTSIKIYKLYKTPIKQNNVPVIHQPIHPPQFNRPVPSSINVPSYPNM